jgi:glycogen debranching enzyme
MFDVRSIPFSARGAWMNISPVIGLHQYADDLHLISHRNGLTPILRLRPLIEDAFVEPTTEATSSVLTWKSQDGRIEAVFDGPERLRLRGRSLDLRLDCVAPELTPFSGMFLYLDPATGDHVFTSYETGRRYRTTVRQGTLSAEGAGALGRAARSLTITGQGDGWEILIEEMTSSRPATVTASTFEDAVRGSQETFAEFVDAVAGWRDQRTPAAELAAYVLWSATVAPDGFMGRESVLMSKHWMDKLWSWDHCFNALALAEGEPRLALDQFLAPFDHQSAEGALPDSVTHSEILYNYVKPPIHGWALAELRSQITDPDTATLTQIRDRLSAWTGFWLRCRRVPGHPLPYYQHGNDSGWDNATTFDHDRVIESPDLAGFLVLQMDVLVGLERELGDAGAAARWEEQAQEMLDALMTLWNGRTFTAHSALTGEQAATSSLLNLLPIVLGDRLPMEVRESLAQSLKSHLTPWGVATEPPTSPHYDPDGYWRGPIWAPSTILVESGLRRAGQVDLADEVSASFRRLCENHGFAENFDALTGEGLRDRAYTWTASAYLRLAAEWVRRPEAP